MKPDKHQNPSELVGRVCRILDIYQELYNEVHWSLKKNYQPKLQFPNWRLVQDVDFTLRLAVEVSLVFRVGIATFQVTSCDYSRGHLTLVTCYRLRQACEPVKYSLKVSLRRELGWGGGGMCEGLGKSHQNLGIWNISLIRKLILQHFYLESKITDFFL